MTALAILYSRQPGNAYTGGGNENAMMFKLATQQVAWLRKSGFDAETPDNVDYNADGTITYEDNVGWVNRRNAARIASGLRGFDYIISNHSNAAGDSCVLWGTSVASVAFGQRILAVLRDNNFMPFGDQWTYNMRKVSEVTQKIPGALIEWGRHDDAAYAAWLRQNIDNGNLAAWSVDVFIKSLGKPAESLAAVKPLNPGTAPAFPLPAGSYFGPRFPLSNARSVSGWYQRMPSGKRGHPGLAVFQQRLRDRGYIITPDGLWGEQTRRVVDSFQRRHGLVVDGLVGVLTWRAAWEA